MNLGWISSFKRQELTFSYAQYQANGEKWWWSWTWVNPSLILWSLQQSSEHGGPPIWAGLKGPRRAPLHWCPEKKRKPKRQVLFCPVAPWCIRESNLERESPFLWKKVWPFDIYRKPPLWIKWFFFNEKLKEKFCWILKYNWLYPGIIKIITYASERASIWK